MKASALAKAPRWNAATRAAPLTGPHSRAAKVVGSCFSIQGVICRLCEEKCPEGAILLIPLCGGYARPQVVAERCTGCGDCLAVCPGGALEMKDARE